MSLNLKTEVPERGLLVSTVRLPVSFDGRPFETMVFPLGGPWLELHCTRSTTEEGARVNHVDVVRMAQAGAFDERLREQEDA